MYFMENILYFNKIIVQLPDITTKGSIVYSPVDHYSKFVPTFNFLLLELVQVSITHTFSHCHREKFIWLK